MAKTKRTEPSAEDIQAAVALVIEADDPEAFDADGYPFLDAVAEHLDGLPQLTVEGVHTAADAVWAAREDAAAGDDLRDDASDEEGSGGGQDGDGGGTEAAPLPSAKLPPARADVIKATERIIAAGEPFERGAPALWALRDAPEVSGSVSKADAAAAYEALTGKPWPRPPTAQELQAADPRRKRYPAALYHAEKPSRTVHNEAEESAAKRDGFARPEGLPDAVWVKAWARETGATPEQQEAALEAVKRDPKRHGK